MLNSSLQGSELLRKIYLVLFEALGLGTGLVSRIEASFFVLLLPRVFVAFKVTGEDFLAAVPFFFFFPGV